MALQFKLEKCHSCNDFSRNILHKIFCTDLKKNQNCLLGFYPTKAEKILKGNLDSIPSPSPSVKIQIMGGKFAWVVKAKHCWVFSINFWKQSLLKITSNVLPYNTSSKLSHPYIFFFLLQVFSNILLLVMESHIISIYLDHFTCLFNFPWI